MNFIHRSFLLALCLAVSACASGPKATPDPVTGKDFAPQQAVKLAPESPTNPPLAGPNRRPTEADVDPRGIDFAKAPHRVAFGSDIMQDEAQPIWKSIVASDPDLFILAGNAIQFSGNTFSEQYKKLSQNPDYRAARQKIPFMIAWDDGDLGTPNGGHDAPSKVQARKEFLAYWPYVKDSLLFNRDGLYHAKMMGGLVTGRRRKKVNGPTLQIIVLDTRSFRSALKKSDDAGRRFLPTTDKAATLLGGNQWEWLEDQLKKPAQLRMIVSAIPVLTGDASDENWSLFPAERDRLFELLRKTHARDVVIISGHRAIGAISKADVKGWGTLFEATASPLNHAGTGSVTDPSFVGTATNQENFGLVTIDWTQKKYRIEIRGLDGKPIQTVDLKM